MYYLPCSTWPGLTRVIGPQFHPSGLTWVGPTKGPETHGVLLIRLPLASPKIEKLNEKILLFLLVYLHNFHHFFHVCVENACTFNTKCLIEFTAQWKLPNIFKPILFVVFCRQFTVLEISNTLFTIRDPLDIWNFGHILANKGVFSIPN